MSSKNSFKPNCLAVAVAGVIVSSGVSAQESNIGEEVVETETVVVVGEATNVVVTSEEIENYVSNSLGDVFKTTPSVSVGGGASGIAQKIFLRGLEDAYVNVTVDGAPQTSTLFHHIGRVTLDPNLLKEVEVQAGAGEATSGPGALGGAIRFKTKNIDDLLRHDERFGGQLKASVFTNDGLQKSANLYGRITDSWGAIAYLSNVDRHTAEDGSGKDILGTAADQDLSFFKVSGEIGNSQHLTMSYEARREEGEFSQRPNWAVDPLSPLFKSEAERDTAVVNYELQYNELLNLEATSYHTTSSFRGGFYDWLSEITSWGFDVRNTSGFGNHSVTYGIEYRDDEVESGYAIPQPEEQHAEEGSVLGIYAQVHSQVTPDLLLSYGARYDDYEYQQKILLGDYYGSPITDEPIELESSEVSLNAGLSYDITDAWTAGLGYAEASRGKEIGDGFTLDKYLYDGGIGAFIDPNLEPEDASNVEASVAFRAGNFNAELAVFNSQIDNTIFDITDAQGYYQNIGTLESTGFELEMSYVIADLEIFFGLSSVDSELDSDDIIFLDDSGNLFMENLGTVPLNGYEYNGLGNSRGDTVNMGLNYAALDTLEMGMNVTFVDDLEIQTLKGHETIGWIGDEYTLKKPSYATLDLFAEWAPIENLTFNLAVINVFDRQYIDHSSVGNFGDVPGYEGVVGPAEPGRDIRLATTFEF
jgi:hemoglobin/transferrin/lactoferrin receptor protein